MRDMIFDLTSPILDKLQGKVSKIKGHVFEVLKDKKRLHNPIAPNQADIVNWILYDRITYAANTATNNPIKFFTVPIGGVDVQSTTKTKVDTNMDLVQRLPDPLWFNCTGIGFNFGSDTAPADIKSLIEKYYMEFWVGQKVYVEGPLSCFPASEGPYASGFAAANTTANTATGQSITTMGNPGLAIYDLRLPAGLGLGVDANGNPATADGLIGVTILQGQSFHVDLKADGGTFTTALNNTTPFVGTGLVIKCRLYGILSRGVQ